MRSNLSDTQRTHTHWSRLGAQIASLQLFHLMSHRGKRQDRLTVEEREKEKTVRQCETKKEG